MPWPFLVALAGIAWLAYMGYLDHKQKLAKAGGKSLSDGALDAVARRLDAAEAERDGLRQRVENLEAIVTSERYELDRAARGALAAPESRPPLALDVPSEEDPESDAAEVARLARRVRGG